MYTKTATTTKENTLSSLRRRLCMDCGHSMVEVDSCTEDSIRFIWYKCIKCNGQWLHKEMASDLGYDNDISPPTRL